MGRLTDDMTRLAGEIHAAREDRKHATVEMKRSVAHLRSAFAADLAGARAVWLGTRASVSPRAVVPATTAPRGRGVEAERREALRKAGRQPRPR